MSSERTWLHVRDRQGKLNWLAVCSVTSLQSDEVLRQCLCTQAQRGSNVIDNSRVSSARLSKFVCCPLGKSLGLSHDLWSREDGFSIAQSKEWKKASFSNN